MFLMSTHALLAASTKLEALWFEKKEIDFEDPLNIPLEYYQKKYFNVPIQLNSSWTERLTMHSFSRYLVNFNNDPI